MNAPVAIGSIINDRYVIERVLGEGGMGVVVLAKHRVLDQRVAIKFLRRDPSVDASSVERFVREAQAAAKVTSPYVVHIHDVAVLTTDGTPYIVMEYLEGATLAVLLGSGPLPVRDALRFANQICEALAETHAAGIVHGDLKPENVYVAGAGDARRVKLLDFGVSRIGLEAATSTAVVMGTPSYMAPEQFDDGVVTPQTDLWAFGALLYEMLTARTAFGNGSPDEVRAQIQKGPAPIEREDMPAGLDHLLGRCLAVDPGKRFTDALQLATALEPFAPRESAVQRIEHISAPVVVGTARNSRRQAATVVVHQRKRGYLPWLVAAVVGIALGGLVLIIVTHGRRPPAEPAFSTPPPPTTTPSAVLAETPPAPSSAAIAEPEPPPPTSASASAVPAPTSRPRPRPRPSFKPGESDRFGTRK